jgi:hypothetical protein
MRYIEYLLNQPMKYIAIVSCMRETNMKFAVISSFELTNQRQCVRKMDPGPFG